MKMRSSATRCFGTNRPSGSGHHPQLRRPPWPQQRPQPLPQRFPGARGRRRRQRRRMAAPCCESSGTATLGSRTSPRVCPCIRPAATAITPSPRSWRGRRRRARRVRRRRRRALPLRLRRRSRRPGTRGRQRRRRAAGAGASCIRCIGWIASPAVRRARSCLGWQLAQDWRGDQAGRWKSPTGAARACHRSARALAAPPAHLRRLCIPPSACAPGLLLLCRTAAAAHALGEQLRDKAGSTVRKRYLARAAGLFPDGDVVCRQPLRPVPGEKHRRECHPDGQSACTTFRRRHYDPVSATSLVDCWPQTGRTHQVGWGRGVAGRGCSAVR